jgi:predicted RNA binding protein YcfA (HicA-like mRNA interferase family)
MATKKLRELFEAGDLNLLPIMNLICLLIPFLLLAAQFVKIGVIRVETPHLSRVPGKAPAQERLDLTLVLTDKGYYVKSAKGSECPEGVSGDQKLCFKREEGKLTPKVLKRLQHHLWQLYAAKYKHHRFAHPDDRHAITVTPEPNVPYEDLVKTLDAIREIPRDATNPPLAATVPASGCALVYDRKAAIWGYAQSSGVSVQDAACMYHRVTLALGSS